MPVNSSQPKIETSPKASSTISKTTCYMCACRCGIDVHLENGKVKYIEGNKITQSIKACFVQKAQLECSTIHQLASNIL